MNAPATPTMAERWEPCSAGRGCPGHKYHRVHDQDLQGSVKPDYVPCLWFSNCANLTVTGQEHPVLGLTPCCDRCARVTGSIAYLVDLPAPLEEPGEYIDMRVVVGEPDGGLKRGDRLTILDADDRMRHVRIEAIKALRERTHVWFAPFGKGDMWLRHGTEVNVGRPYDAGTCYVCNEKFKERDAMDQFWVYDDADGPALAHSACGERAGLAYWSEEVGP